MFTVHSSHRINLKWFEKDITDALLEPKFCTVAAKLKPLAHTPSLVGAPAPSHIEGVNDVS